MRPPAHRAARAGKRLFDLVGAALLLLPGLPLIAAVAAAVLLDSGRPLLHRERRLGLRGRAFDIYKFRCLHSNYGGAGSVAPEDDARLTPTGRFLRRWRLDELPQLALVLAGKMSLVGPRPMPAAHADTLPPQTRELLCSVRPGLTGAGALAFLAEDAVMAGRENPEALYLAILLPAKAQIELEYIRNRTLCGDLALLLRTPATVWSHTARRQSRQRLERLIDRAQDAPPAG